MTLPGSEAAWREWAALPLTKRFFERVRKAREGCLELVIEHCEPRAVSGSAREESVAMAAQAVILKEILDCLGFEIVSDVATKGEAA